MRRYLHLGVSALPAKPGDHVTPALRAAVRDVLEALRTTLPPSVFMPVLVLTADVTPEAKERALRAGAKDFLALVSDKRKNNDSAIIFTVRGSAPGGNSPVSVSFSLCFL